MRLPHQLEIALEQIAEGVQGLSAASAAISERYRGRDFTTAALRNDAERLAYMLVRMPATFAAVCRALELTGRTIPQLDIESVLDLGAGPGTATWAATALFPAIASATLVERDRAMAALGSKLMSGADSDALQQSRWITADLERHSFAAEQADLVVLSYVSGELQKEKAEKLVRSAWSTAKKLLLVVEPGTKAGFATVESLRWVMLQEGAELAAPCPHKERCPMSGGTDWCHFSERVERSALHRRIKHGELGHEDEKFSFVAFTKAPADKVAARVVRHPLYRPRLVELALCENGGLTHQTVTKAQGEEYRKAKKLRWGDGYLS